MAADFSAVAQAFAAQLAADPGHSAQLAIYHRDERVVDLSGGPALAAPDAVTGVFSVTKGAAAIALGTLVRAGELDLDARVARYWPPFAAAGKGEISVRQLLSHQAGLVGVDGGGLTVDDVLDSARGAERLAAQRPAWRPGALFGYHGVTIGIFIEELVRRITGVSLQALYEATVRAPRGIDFYLGLPEALESRFAPLITPAAAAAGTPLEPVIDDGLESLGYRMPVPGDGGVSYGPNDRAVRAAGPAAIGGVGSARGLAALYAAAQGFTGEPLLDPGTIGAMSEVQVFGIDRILGQEMCFGVVFQVPHPRIPFASHRGFGHDGAGGALAFADPRYELSFGYIANPVVVPGGADRRAIELSALARRAVRDASRPI